MSTIKKEEVYNALQRAGFNHHSPPSNIFLLGNSKALTPAFLCNIYRKNREVRLGGAIGIFFFEFEDIWERSKRQDHAKLDSTLPVIMLVDNYVDLINSEVLEYSASVSEIYDRSVALYEFCSKLPRSIEEFDEALLNNSMAGKNISSYLHIFDYNQDNHPFLVKSVDFIHWFAAKWPRRASNIYRCLTARQLKRLGSEPRNVVLD